MKKIPQNQKDDDRRMASAYHSISDDNSLGSLRPPALQFKADLSNGDEEEKTTQLKGQTHVADSPPEDSNENTDNKTPYNLSNKTGLPNQLKAGIENLSGFSMDDVNVNYNSNKPSQLKAHAFAQGTNIHVAPGQEKHVPHEAWHVVQQKQGRVKANTQLKGEIPINDDVGLEKEADEMGAKAMNLGPKDRKSATLSNEAPFSTTQRKPIQLKSESVSITGVTHLVKMDGNSIFEGDYSKVLRSGDLVQINTSKKYNSRRGPNQEDDDLRDEDRDGDHIYKYYQAEKVNGEPLAEDDLYLRDETFLRSDATSDDKDYNAAHESLTEKRSKYNLLKASTSSLLDKLKSDILDQVTEEDETGELQSEIDKAAPAISDLKGKINEKAPKTGSEIDAEIQAIHGLLGMVSQKLSSFAHAAANSGDPGLGMNIINLAETAFNLSETARKGKATTTGSDYETGKDLAGEILGYEDIYQTSLGAIAAVVGAPGVLESGSAAASVTTGVSYFLGPVGIIFGSIGVFLGLKAIYRGYNSEKKLKLLLPTLEDEKLSRVARYAKEQKRKKKLGGAITAIAGGAAVVAGIVGIVALSVATLGIGAAILGVGAALIGLGIVIGKLIHHFRKRKKWRKSMAEGVKGAVREQLVGAFPQHLMALGAAAIAAETDDSLDSKAADKALEDACVEMAESRRELMAKKAVHYYFDGSPKEKYESMLVLKALNITEEKLQKVEGKKGRKGAISLVAKKLKSW